MIRELVSHARTALVTAHPDDESIGAGALMKHLNRCHFIYVTTGAPLNGADADMHGFSSVREYAIARQRELGDMFGRAGIHMKQVIFLGYSDQEAARHLVQITQAVRALIAKLRLQVIVTHAYEGGHPDHDAAAFAVHAACRLTAMCGSELPEVIEMAGYHSGPRGMVTGQFQPSDGSEAQAETIELNSEEQSFKSRLLESFVSQKDTLAAFPTVRERFRPSPDYDFTAPPGPDTLLYEQFPWGMSGIRFRQLVRCAMDQLGLEGML
jgi:LmbE family N-acetylglucosaminyl deacetylase